MRSPYEALKAAREERGLSVSEVSGLLDVRPAYIEALEDGSITNVLGLGHVRSLVSNYAELLQLDPDPLVASVPFAAPAQASWGQASAARGNRSLTPPGRPETAADAKSASPAGRAQEMDSPQTDGQSDRPTGDTEETLGPFAPLVHDSTRAERSGFVGPIVLDTVAAQKAVIKSARRPQASPSGSRGGWWWRRGLLATTIVMGLALATAIALQVVGAVDFESFLPGTGSLGEANAQATTSSSQAAGHVASTIPEGGQAQVDVSTSSTYQGPTTTVKATTTLKSTTMVTAEQLVVIPANTVVASDPFELRLRSKGQVWVRVKDQKTMETIYLGNVVPAEEVVLRASHALLLFVGEPPLLSVFIDGVEMKSPSAMKWLATHTGVVARK